MNRRNLLAGLLAIPVVAAVAAALPVKLADAAFLAGPAPVSWYVNMGELWADIRKSNGAFTVMAVNVPGPMALEKMTTARPVGNLVMSPDLCRPFADRGWLKPFRQCEPASGPTYSVFEGFYITDAAPAF